MHVNGFCGVLHPVGREILSLVVMLTMATTIPCVGQERWKGPAPGFIASLALEAVLPSSIKLDSESVPVVAAARETNEGVYDRVDASVTIEWNVDSRVRQIQLIGYFRDSANAVQDDHGHSVNAAQLAVSIDGSDWKPFPNRILPHHNSELILVSQSIGQHNRQGKRICHLRVKMCRAEGLQDPSLYQGVLHLRALMQ